MMVLKSRRPPPAAIEAVWAGKTEPREQADRLGFWAILALILHPVRTSINACDHRRR
jgi:hypothetical protein